MSFCVRNIHSVGGLCSISHHPSIKSTIKSFLNYKRWNYQKFAKGHWNGLKTRQKSTIHAHVRVFCFVVTHRRSQKWRGYCFFKITYTLWIPLKNEKNEKFKQVSNTVTNLLPNVTNCYTEKDIDKDIDIEIDKKKIMTRSNKIS